MYGFVDFLTKNHANHLKMWFFGLVQPYFKTKPSLGGMEQMEKQSRALKTISILVWFRSSQLPWRDIWWQIGCQILCPNVSAHGASWVLMMHHDHISQGPTMLKYHACPQQRAFWKASPDPADPPGSRGSRGSCPSKQNSLKLFIP